jgi:hypothetical protein
VGPLYNDNYLQFFEYTLRITVDSKALRSGAYADSAGPYFLEIQASDVGTSPNRTLMRVELGIDNLYPLGAYSANPRESTQRYSIQGTATDYADNVLGTAWGIEKVLVYFEKTSGGYVNHVTGGTAAFSETLTVKDMTAGGTLQSVYFPGANASYGITIDRDVVDLGIQTRGFSDSGTTKNWFALYDTTPLTDGPIYLNYLIFDQAGNVTRYRKDLYIENKIPQIGQVLLKTDLDASGTAGNISAEESAVTLLQLEAGKNNYDASAFKVRNGLLEVTLVPVTVYTGKTPYS